MELHLGRGARGQEQLVFFDTDGRDITFDAPVPGEGVFSVAEGIGVQCTPGGEYVVVTAEGRYQWFTQVDPSRPQVLSLLRMEDRNGSYHSLRYDDMGRFTHLADSAGRVLELQYADGANRLQQVVLRVGAEGETPHVLVRYEHDRSGALAQVQDRSGQVSRRFAYAGGRLVSHQVTAQAPMHASCGTGPTMANNMCSLTSSMRTVAEQPPQGTLYRGIFCGNGTAITSLSATRMPWVQ
jgi:hypothetical protein